MSPQTEAGRHDAGGEHDDIIYPSTLPFILVHLACFAAIWSGITWQAVALGIGLYWLRIFAIGAGYHRLFSHRAYSTSRVFQFILAVIAQSSAQKSVLWWASKHRHHHLHSDTELDVHSPRHKGFLYSHVGWIFTPKHETTDLTKVADLARYPELMWLHRFELVPAIVLAILCFLIAGWPGLVVGFLWSTVAVYHGTFCINSLAHVRGSKRYVTGDDSRNNAWLALLPGNAPYNVRRLTLLETHAADLAPVYAAARGERQTSEADARDTLAVFETRQHSRFSWPRQYHDVGHLLVQGATGSGKSFS